MKNVNNNNKKSLISYEKHVVESPLVDVRANLIKSSKVLRLIMTSAQFI